MTGGGGGGYHSLLSSQTLVDRSCVLRHWHLLYLLLPTWHVRVTRDYRLQSIGSLIWGVCLSAHQKSGYLFCFPVWVNGGVRFFGWSWAEVAPIAGLIGIPGINSIPGPKFISGGAIQFLILIQFLVPILLATRLWFWKPDQSYDEWLYWKLHKIIPFLCA